MAIIRLQHGADRDGTFSDWIDHRGRFAFGKHKGELIEKVAADDPSYIRWIVGEVEDISDEDRNLLAVQLRYVGK
jgi:hypothetical protein